MTETITTEQYQATAREDDIHIHVLDWCRANENRRPELAYVVHVPNEGKRSWAQGKKLKAMGMRAGFPDIFLPHAAGGFHGFVCELKSRKGRLSADQFRWLNYLRDSGFYTLVTYDPLRCVEELELYLDARL